VTRRPLTSAAAHFELGLHLLHVAEGGIEVGRARLLVRIEPLVHVRLLAEEGIAFVANARLTLASGPRAEAPKVNIGDEGRLPRGRSSPREENESHLFCCSPLTAVTRV